MALTIWLQKGGKMRYIHAATAILFIKDMNTFSLCFKNCSAKIYNANYNKNIFCYMYVKE